MVLSQIGTYAIPRISRYWGSGARSYVIDEELWRRTNTCKDLEEADIVVGSVGDTRVHVIGITTEPVEVMVENMKEPWRMRPLVVRELGVPFILSLKSMRELSISLETR